MLGVAKAKSEYTVVARRYRPQQFDDLIGQEHVAQALKNALASGRVAHAYLFTGARGVGKTSTARILAKALNCDKGPTATPCNKCSSCVAIAMGDDIDVREIDGASNRTIEDIRAIRAEVATRPTRGRYKIYIIDEVHMLTRESFNALLKTLEEPPPHVKFIFATTEVQKVPITILSRCQRFDFGAIRSERIAEQLRAIVSAEKFEADDESLDIIARRAGGSMRDAQSLLDQLLAFGGDKLTAETVQKLLGIAGPERVLSLADAVLRHDAKSVVEQLADLAGDGLQLAELLDQLIEYWRDLMLLASAGKEAPGLTTPVRHRETLAKHAAAMSLDTIMAGLDILIQAKTKVRIAGQIKTLLQMALIRLCRLDDLVPVSQLASLIGQLGPSSAAPSAARTLAGSSTYADATQSSDAKKKAELIEPSPVAAELNAETLSVIWPQIVSDIGGMLGSQLQRAGLPAIFGPNTLVLTFPAEYNTYYEHCSNPVNKQRIEGALRQRAGPGWTVRLDRRSSPAPSAAVNGEAATPAAPAISRRARYQELMQKIPLLKRVEEKLGALPMDIEEEFGTIIAVPTAPSADELPSEIVETED